MIKLFIKILCNGFTTKDGVQRSLELNYGMQWNNLQRKTECNGVWS